MSFQIIIEEITDVQRVSHFQQDIFLRINNKDDKVLISETLTSTKTIFSSPWVLSAPTNDYLEFRLVSLDKNSFNKILCFGYLDLGRFTKRKMNEPIVETVIMESCYNNFAQVHLCMIRRKEEKTTIFERRNGEKMNKKEKRKCYTESDQGLMPFYKGACNSYNIFSFLDSRAKGQFFTFYEKPIRK